MARRLREAVAESHRLNNEYNLQPKRIEVKEAAAKDRYTSSDHSNSGHLVSCTPMSETSANISDTKLKQGFKTTNETSYDVVRSIHLEEDNRIEEQSEDDEDYLCGCFRFRRRRRRRRRGGRGTRTPYKQNQTTEEEKTHCTQTFRNELKKEEPKILIERELESSSVMIPVDCDVERGIPQPTLVSMTNELSNSSQTPNLQLISKHHLIAMSTKRQQNQTSTDVSVMERGNPKPTNVEDMVLKTLSSTSVSGVPNNRRQNCNPQIDQLVNRLEKTDSGIEMPVLLMSTRAGRMNDNNNKPTGACSGEEQIIHHTPPRVPLLKVGQRGRHYYQRHGENPARLVSWSRNIRERQTPLSTPGSCALWSRRAYNYQNRAPWIPMRQPPRELYYRRTPSPMDCHDEQPVETTDGKKRTCEDIGKASDCEDVTKEAIGAVLVDSDTSLEFETVDEDGDNTTGDEDTGEKIDCKNVFEEIDAVLSTDSDTLLKFETVDKDTGEKIDCKNVFEEIDAVLLTDSDTSLEYETVDEDVDRPAGDEVVGKTTDCEDFSEEIDSALLTDSVTTLALKTVDEDVKKPVGDEVVGKITDCEDVIEKTEGAILADSNAMITAQKSNEGDDQRTGQVGDFFTLTKSESSERLTMLLPHQANRLAGEAETSSSNFISVVGNGHQIVLRRTSCSQFDGLRKAVAKAGVKFQDEPEQLGNHLSFKEKLEISAAKYKKLSRQKSMPVRRNDIAYRINSKMRSQKRSINDKTSKTFSHPQLDKDSDESNV